MVSHTAATLQLQTISYGSEALSLAGESGTILAVVSGAVYLQTAGGRVVGLVDARAPDGPLNVRVRGFAAAHARLRECTGAPFKGDGEGVLIAGQVRLNLAGATPWRPALPRMGARGKALLAGISALREAISALGLEDGLGQLALFTLGSLNTYSLEQTNPSLRRAAEAMERLLGAWDREDTTGIGDAGLRLLGLGPGLTPSGDDLLAGLVAVCGWAGSTNERFAVQGRALTETVLREAPWRTTFISARMLAHAPEGFLYEPAMDLGRALFEGRPAAVGPAASRLFEIGHTSGADTAAGIALGARLLAAPRG